MWKNNKKGNKKDPNIAKIKEQKFTIRMQKKLVVLVGMVFLAFFGLAVQLYLINRDSGEQYKKQVLSQQRYDSTTIPYRRGAILDSRGTTLAVSEKVYNVILDAKAVLERDSFLEPTLEAIGSQFGLNTDIIRTFITTNPNSQYHILLRRVSYDDIAGYREMQADRENNPHLRGVWFEEEFKRYYPNSTLACDVIGFTTNDSQGLSGLERFYNNTLRGTPGREYGFLNEDSELERTTIAAIDGNSIVTTLDSNIQAITEKYLREFNEEYQNNHREGYGAHNIGAIIMEVDTGNVLAMASFPDFDLNDFRNTDRLIGMQMLDREGNRVLPSTVINEDNLALMTDEEINMNLNALWRNFCVTDTYEPGSVIKPFTTATALESGRINGDEIYFCDGKLEVGDYDIRCNVIYGHGEVSVARSMEVSCNVAMMRIGMATGRDTYVDFQRIYNFGLRTNIDLEGEARTASLVYNKNNMRITELATCSFGQGFNVTMIQMISGFCSLINGGNYYEPRLVKKILSPTGATVRNIEPRLLKQTISPETSNIIRKQLIDAVIGEEGTGRSARPAGYIIGGKTGTAEMVPRDKTNYVVSFMGFAPVENPQIAIYVVIDRPNVRAQDSATYATRLARSILTEVLPYLNIFMTEELSDKERAELEELRAEILSPIITANDNEEEEEGENEAEDESGSGETFAPHREIWRSFPVDPETGYAVDPDTGDFVDRETGRTIGGSFQSTGFDILPPTDGVDDEPP